MTAVAVVLPVLAAVLVAAVLAAIARDGRRRPCGRHGGGIRIADADDSAAEHLAALTPQAPAPDRGDLVQDPRPGDPLTGTSAVRAGALDAGGTQPPVGDPAAGDALPPRRDPAQAPAAPAAGAAPMLSSEAYRDTGPMPPAVVLPRKDGSEVRVSPRGHVSVHPGPGHTGPHDALPPHEPEVTEHAPYQRRWWQWTYDDDCAGWRLTCRSAAGYIAARGAAA